MKKTITTREYADLRGISIRGVNKAVATGNNMPGVIKIEKHGRFYLLVVELDETGELK
jgi:hypothetical protein